LKEEKEKRKNGNEWKQKIVSSKKNKEKYNFIVKKYFLKIKKSIL